MKVPVWLTSTAKLKSETALQAKPAAARPSTGRSGGAPRSISRVAMVAITTSVTGTSRLGAVATLVWRICGNRVTLAMNSTDPPMTMPSSSIRVRSVPRRRASGKITMPAIPTSMHASSAMSLGDSPPGVYPKISSSTLDSVASRAATPKQNQARRRRPVVRRYR